MIKPVEISDRNTVVETYFDGSKYSSNVSDDVTIGDTVLRFFPWLGWFEGKVSLVDKTKSGNVFKIKCKDNTSKHWSSEEFFSSKAGIPIGGLFFGLYEPFKNPHDTLVKQWLKYVIVASSFVNYVTERVRIKRRSVKMRDFIEYNSITTMNTQ